MSFPATWLARSMTFRLAAVCLSLTLIGTACENDTAEPFLEPGAQANGAGRAGSQRSTEASPEGRAERRAERRAEVRAERRARRTVLVSRVVDGDTIEVQLDGTTGIRLIGIDTPETVHPTEPVGCFGPAASDFTKHKLEGQMVRLEYDVERTDLYGRTLAYVFADGLLFNETLVARGYAQVTTYPPNVRYVNRFLAAQRSARGADQGFWGQCSHGQRSDEGGGASRGGGRRGEDGGKRGCDPNYSGACIPSYPPDIDCPDAGAEGFRSTGSDPHGFDSDGDGLACE
ncbi:MAG: thermonuclease family protein [Actinobacteria bacterium]|nr:thermonuclease family protein [Actinomycetota bacterium]